MNEWLMKPRSPTFIRLEFTDTELHLNVYLPSLRLCAR